MALWDILRKITLKVRIWVRSLGFHLKGVELSILYVNFHSFHNCSPPSDLYNREVVSNLWEAGVVIDH